MYSLYRVFELGIDPMSNTGLVAQLGEHRTGKVLFHIHLQAFCLEKNCLLDDIYHLFLSTVVNVVSLLLHVVVLPDHFPLASHDRTRDPTSRCPWIQEKEAWEPNEDPHEREAMEP